MPQAFDGKPASTLDEFKAAVAKAKDGQVAVMTFHGVPDIKHPWVNTDPATSPVPIVLKWKSIWVIAAVLFLIAGIGSAFPFAIWDFMGWRIIGGFAIGLAAIVSPMYIAEIAPAHLRGRLSSLFQFAIVIGIFATQVVNQIVLNMAGGSSSNPLGPLDAWQWMFVMMAVPATIYFLLAFTLPESPRYLVAINAGDRAKAVLESIFIEPVEAKITAIRASRTNPVNPTCHCHRSPSKMRYRYVAR